MAAKLDFDTLEEGIERVAKKHKTTGPKTIKSIEAIISELNRCKLKLLAHIPDPDSTMAVDNPEQQEETEKERSNNDNNDNKDNNDNMIVAAALRELGLMVGQHSKPVHDFKDLHAPISKLGKLVDKTFRGDMEKATVGGARYDSLVDPESIRHVVAHHLYRQGRFEMADQFAKETHIDPSKSAEMKEPFVLLYQILTSLRAHELEPAIQWAQARRTALHAIGSSLEFALHRVAFLTLMTADSEMDTSDSAGSGGSSSKENSNGGGGTQAALQYARTHFPAFSEHHMEDIQHLMGCFVYAKRLSKSPYAALFHPSNIPTLWDDVARQFTQNSCTLMGLPQDSPLHISITAGFKALPTLNKLAALQLVKAAGDEMATAEVSLGPALQFHSIFACPVSREQSTPDSPPMLLPCGHVISKTSMLKLIRGSSTKFKCPYCPSEQVVSQTKQLYF